MTDTVLNEILLRRDRAVLLEPGDAETPVAHIASILKNIESLGFTAHPDLFAALCTLPEERLLPFYHQLVKMLRQMVGAHVSFEPMYPNFPDQVMEAGKAELYVNAIMHYLGSAFGLRILPAYSKAERPPLPDDIELTPIGLATEDSLLSITRNLLGARSSLSATDREDVCALLDHFGDRLDEVLPTELPHKENLTFVTSYILEGGDAFATDVLLTKYYRTATDVLRLATAMSDGDVSLAANTKFRSFKRRERRLLLSLLDRIRGPLADMQRHRERWLRLGERLHPGEYAERYPDAAEAFQALRDGNTVQTFNSKVELALAENDVSAALRLLSKRPGELARRLDHLLRLSEDTRDAVVAAFVTVAEKVSAPVLLQVHAHFRHRNQPSELRSFFPKGNVARVVTVPNQLPELPDEICQRVVSTCESALRETFSEREPLGSVYVDPQLERYLVPFSQRSASRSLRTIVRGSRLPFPDGDTIRFFLWWKEGEVDGKHTGRVDIDLSSVLYDSDWNYLEHISYTNLKSHKYQAAHSGDIVTAPDGACEFIDLHIPSIVDFGGRWVVMNVLSFTRQPFTAIPECFAGWMSRQEPGSGEVFEPKTVADKVDLAADTRISIPVIMDLVKREMFWADLALNSYPRWQVNVESNQRGIVQMGKAITSLKKQDLHTLLVLHGSSRGHLVDSPDDADTVFSVESGIQFDTAQIMSDFL